MLFFYWAGNELCGKGIGISVSPYQYANDVTILRNIVQKVYREAVQKPLVIAPITFITLDQVCFHKPA